MLDVIELLARRADQRLTLVELIRELGITPATAHAIVMTLTARGWVERDPIDKSYAIGSRTPARGAKRQRGASARRRGALGGGGARARARLRYVRHAGRGDVLVVVHFVTTEESDVEANAGDRVPLAPFGLALIAWEPASARRAWIERSAIPSPAHEARLEKVLAVIRERGYGVERMSPSASRALGLVAALRDDVMSESMRAIIEQLLAEISTVDYLPGELEGGRAKYPVSTIAAPVFDQRSRVKLNLAVRPFRKLPCSRIEHIGRVVSRAAGRISRGPAPEVESHPGRVADRLHRPT